MRLAEQLEYAHTERGRLEGVLGNIPLAEDSLWRQYFKHEDDSAPKWALREFFHRYPYEWSVQVSPNGLRCAAFAPQAGLFLLGANTGIGVYNASVGVSSRRITGLGSGVSLLAVSADAGRCFAALDNGRVVRVNLMGDAGCELLTTYAPHLGAVRAIALSPDGSLLATSGNDRTVRIWDAESLELRAMWNAHPEVAMVLAFSPDSRALVTAPGPSGVQDLSTMAYARVWRLSDLALLREYPVVARGGVTAAAFSEDNMTLVVATGQRQLNLYNLETNTLSSHEVTAGTSAVSSVSSLRGSSVQLLAIGDSVWEATASGLRPLPSVGLQSQLLISLGVVDDSVIIVCRDGLIRRIAVTPEYRRSRVADFDTWCFGTEFSPDGSTLVVAGGNNEIRVVDAVTLQARHRIAIVEKGIMRARAIRFIDGSDVFAAGCGDGAVRFCSAATGTMLSVLPTGAPEIYSMERTPDGKFLVTGHADGTIRFLDIATCGFQLLPSRMPRRVEGIAFTPDGSQMITSGLFGGIQIWDMKARETIASVETSGIPWAVACSPDGSRLLVSTYDGVVDVFDSTYAFMTRLRAHRRLIPGLCFSRDGSLFATGSEDTTVRIWDARTLRTLASLETDGGEVITVAFNPDSSRLAASNATRFTTVYDFPRLDAYLTGNEALQRRRVAAQSVAPGTR